MLGLVIGPTMTDVLIGRGEDTETRREGGGVTMKGCDDKPRSANDCWEPPAAWGETWTDSQSHLPTA